MRRLGAGFERMTHSRTSAMDRRRERILEVCGCGRSPRSCRDTRRRTDRGDTIGADRRTPRRACRGRVTSRRRVRGASRAASSSLRARDDTRRICARRAPHRDRGNENRSPSAGADAGQLRRRRRGSARNRPCSGARASRDRTRGARARRRAARSRSVPHDNRGARACSCGFTWHVVQVAVSGRCGVFPSSRSSPV